MLILRDSSDWHLCFSRKMSIYYELISLPEKRKSGILDAYRWIFKTAQKGMDRMHNLRKTIRYGILSVLGVIVMGICMRYAIKTATAAITALTVGIRNRSGKRGGSHREEK